MNGQIYAISFGGSLLMDSSMTFDTDFIKAAKELLLKRAETGDKFVLVVGGGKTARYYQNAASALGFDQEKLDLLGIKATYVNAELVRLAFDVKAPVFHNPEELPSEMDEPILVCSGWKPGRSTDYVAAYAAKHLGAENVINLSNTDYIYDSDPNENPNAKKLEDMTWAEYHEMTGINEWAPGLHVPFDPVASRLCAENNISLYYMNGKNLANLELFFEGNDYEGSIVHPAEENLA